MKKMLLALGLLVAALPAFSWIFQVGPAQKKALIKGEYKEILDQNGDRCVPVFLQIDVKDLYVLSDALGIVQQEAVAGGYVVYAPYGAKNWKLTAPGFKYAVLKFYPPLAKNAAYLVEIAKQGQAPSALRQHKTQLNAASFAESPASLSARSGEGRGSAVIWVNSDVPFKEVERALLHGPDAVPNLGGFTEEVRKAVREKAGGWETPYKVLNGGDAAPYRLAVPDGTLLKDVLRQVPQEFGEGMDWNTPLQKNHTYELNIDQVPASAAKGQRPQAVNRAEKELKAGNWKIQ